MCFTSELNLTFESVCPTVKSLGTMCLMCNLVFHYKYPNNNLWINALTSKCSAVSGRLSFNSPFHHAVHLFTQRYPRRHRAKRSHDKLLTYWYFFGGHPFTATSFWFNKHLEMKKWQLLVLPETLYFHLFFFLVNRGHCALTRRKTLWLMQHWSF